MLSNSLKVWLDVSQATDSGTLTIPDRMGGASATQATAGNKPTLSTTSNGLPKLVSGIDKWLQLPLSAGINDPDYFGVALWMKTTDVTQLNGDLFNVTSSTNGLAAANRLSIRQPQDDLSVFTWIPPAPSGNVRSSRTLSGSALLQNGVWKFMAMEFIGVKPTELERMVYKDAGTIVASPYMPTFSQAQGTAVDTPSTLIVTTGSAILLNRSAVASPTNGFFGETTDWFFYDPRTMSSDDLVQIAQYEVPVG